jgi:hypothetical protein
MMLVATRLGDLGFVAFAKGLHRLDVIDHDELLRWLELHGDVIRATEPPLDDGERFDEDALLALAREFGGWVE